MIAALYVQKDGAYYGLPDVDPWDEERDARLYEGPWSVVAHPPCARWSRLAGFVEARWGYKRGEDEGCFAAALAAVRRFGGVIEHPAYSDAWAKYGLPRTNWHGGWTHSLLDDGASCYVEQGRYGLPVKKATWLYAFGCELPELRWGYKRDSDGETPNGSFGGIDGWRDRFGGRTGDYLEGNHPTHKKGLTSVTPPEFRNELLAMARSAQPSLEILPLGSVV